MISLTDDGMLLEDDGRGVLLMTPFVVGVELRIDPLTVGVTLVIYQGKNL